MTTLLILAMLLVCVCVGWLTAEIVSLRRVLERSNWGFGPQKKEWHSISAPPPTDIHEVLVRQGQSWIHASWARKDSKAWHAAYNNPCQALKDNQGRMELGKQA